MTGLSLKLCWAFSRALAVLAWQSASVRADGNDCSAANSSWYASSILHTAATTPMCVTWARNAQRRPERARRPPLRTWPGASPWVPPRAEQTSAPSRTGRARRRRPPGARLARRTARAAGRLRRDWRAGCRRRWRRTRGIATTIRSSDLTCTSMALSTTGSTQALRSSSVRVARCCALMPRGRRGRDARIPHAAARHPAGRASCTAQRSARGRRPSGRARDRLLPPFRSAARRTVSSRGRAAHRTPLHLARRQAISPLTPTITSPADSSPSHPLIPPPSRWPPPAPALSGACPPQLSGGAVRRARLLSGRRRRLNVPWMQRAVFSAATYRRPRLCASHARHRQACQSRRRSRKTRPADAVRPALW